MSQLIVHGGKRVLTSVQLGESCDTDAKIINRNFSRNQDRFIEGEHYFRLSGEALKAFKAERPDDVNLKFVAMLNLWTEKGVWLHASFLKNKRAKEAINALINSYYKVIERPQQSPIQEQIAIPYERFCEMESRLIALENQMREVTLHSGEQLRLRKEVNLRVNQLSGMEKGARQVLYRAIWSAVKERYQVGSYRDVKQRELQDALRFVAAWTGEN